MYSVQDSDLLSESSSGSKIFKTIEDDCTRKINNSNGDSCKNDLALLFNNRGHAKYMQVEFVSAVEDYNRALQLNPNLAVGYYNRGTICYRMGNFKEALSDLQKAVDLERSNQEFIAGLAECAKMINAQLL